MDALSKVQGTKSSTFRVIASAALVSVMLGACSSVPDAINPVSWYKKTTDFFSGDSQAADTGSPQSKTEMAEKSSENRGLSADPNAPAPAPAPAQQVARAPGGLSADQTSGNYASPPIERQSAPSNVFTPQTAAAPAPPAPIPAPQVAVTAAPTPLPTPMNSARPKPMPKTMDMASTPPKPPAMPFGATQTPEQQYASAAPMSRPTPFEFPPANAMSPLGHDSFETVVITADGMEAMAEPAPRLNPPSMSASRAPSSAQFPSAQFPEPGVTTTVQTDPVAIGGMLRVATIHFANNSSTLDSRDRSILGAVIQLQRERGGRVVVVGHASARTKDMDYIKHQMVNFEISMQRAGTIGSELEGLGLPGEALEVQAVSDTVPLFLEVMPSGEAGNRRVEIYLAAATT